MWDPHEPFDAPAFDLARYADPAFAGDQVIYPQYGRPDYLSPEEHNHIRALYAALVTLSDRWLGHLLDKLDVLGISDDTLVIHLTDHGHLFGDHDLQGKPGGTLGRLYEPSIRIPLMIRHPQGLGAGKRIAGLTQHVDLLSTILEFLDVATPPGVEGHSLWPLVRGETDRIRTHAFTGRYPLALVPDRRGQAIQVATFDGAAGGDTDTTRLVEALTVTTEEWALISSPRGRPSELYHLCNDPAQARNVLTEHPAVARDLHAALLGFLESVGTAESRIAPFRGDVTASDAEPAPPTFAADTPLFVAEDAQGTTLTFRSEATARLLGFTNGGSSLRRTTFGALARTNPRALFCTPTQYYRLSDLA
jgi:arylsulfatase A-like enzyme